MSFVLNPFTGQFDAINSCSFQEIVQAGQTKVIYSTDKNCFNSAQFQFQVTDNSVSLIRTFIMATQRIGNDVKDTISSRLGNGLDFSIIANVVTDQFQLSVTNNESFDLIFKFKMSEL